MKHFKRLLLVVAILMLALPTLAQEEKWRNFEVVLHGGLAVPSSGLSDWQDSLGAKTGFNFGLEGGYYFTLKLCAGLYFNYTQTGMEGDWDRKFRMYDFGAYFKYAFAGESFWEPYLKMSVGLNSPKFPTFVAEPGDVPRLREQSYDPNMAAAIYAGLLYYTFDFGGVYFEAGYHYDFLEGTKANYHGVEYEIEENISYLDLRFGVNVYFGPE